MGRLKSKNLGFYIRTKFFETKGVDILKKFFKFWCLGVIALIILLVIVTALSGGDDKASTEQKSEETETVVSDNNKIDEEVKTENEEEIIKETNDGVSREFKSALKKAESYASAMHMSKKAIYDQLVSEYGGQFPEDAAQYAIDNINHDWKENALRKAESYAEQMDMSSAAIYDQLISEYGGQFTPEEAQYAIDNLK